MLVVFPYVDDLLIIGNNTKQIDELMKDTRHSFEVPNLGLITYQLEMEITQLKDDFFICQKNYTIEIIKKLKLQNCKQISTPMKQI